MRNIELVEWFEERLENLQVLDETRAYMVGLFYDMHCGGDRDLSNESIVLVYAEAVQMGDFRRYQRCADWGLWVSVCAPESLEAPDVVTELSMSCYEACDRIMLRKWPAFNELATSFPVIVEDARHGMFSR